MKTPRPRWDRRPGRDGVRLPARGAALLVAALAAFGACAALTGCGESSAGVPVVQPIAFPHRNHLNYFSSGEHRREKIRMHLDILGEEEAPEELAEGECTACHDDLAEKPACGGCHLLFQDGSLRSWKEVRSCIGCHRQAWSGPAAGIPGNEVCRSCHGGAPRTNGSEEARLRDYLARGEEVPWRRVYDYLPGDIVFSHERHVMLGRIDCRRCHGEVATGARPLQREVVLSMENCMDCHELGSANRDCLACHK